jgi:hypothetical protein
LAAVLQFAHVITGFRSRELRTYIQSRFGLSPDDYTAAQLRYDLMKLSGKGLIRRLDGMTRYVITPKGMAQGTAIIKLTECLKRHDRGIGVQFAKSRFAPDGTAKGLPSCSLCPATIAGTRWSARSLKWIVLLADH